MKKLLLCLFYLGMNQAWANSNQLPPKQVMLPFQNEIISSATHNGLYFSYNLISTPAKKVVCTVAKAYKVWFEFRDKGVLRSSSVFGGSAKVIFTSLGKTGDIDQSTSIYHVAQGGSIDIFHTDNQSSQAVASCHYEIDNAR